MTRSYKKDIQLLMSILQRQNDIKEAVKMLADDTQHSLTCIDASVLKAFRNMIDHTYEKVNKNCNENAE